MSVTQRDLEHAERMAKHAFDAVSNAVKASGRPVTMDNLMDTFMSLVQTQEYYPDDSAEWATAAGRCLTGFLASTLDEMTPEGVRALAGLEPSSSAPPPSSSAEPDAEHHDDKAKTSSRRRHKG